MRAVIPLLLLSSLLWAGEREDALFAAARKGDVQKTKELIAQGVDVDATWRYEQTALHMAARGGHTEVVRLLLEKGARADVKDSFYGMTAIGAAADKGGAEIVRMLLEKGASGADQALLTGVAGGHTGIVKAVLDSGKAGQETKNRALGRAATTNRGEIAEILKAAGAVMPPLPNFKVDAKTLARYAGTYRGEGGEWVLSVDGDQLKAAAGPQVLALGAFDAVTFQPIQFDTARIIMQIDGERVTGFLLKMQGAPDRTFQRVEAK